MHGTATDRIRIWCTQQLSYLQRHLQVYVQGQQQQQKRSGQHRQFGKHYQQHYQHQHQQHQLDTTLIHQILPLLVLILVPAFFLLVASSFRRYFFPRRALTSPHQHHQHQDSSETRHNTQRLPRMVLENLGWLWGGGNSHSHAGASSSSSRSGSSGSGSGSSNAGGYEKTKKIKKHRTHEQVVGNGSAKHEHEKGTHHNDDDDGYYPGLVNISGTYCFMNSTLQALASLTYLQPHIDAVHAKAEILDVPTPVIDALQDLFHRLNTPHSSYHAIRPVDIIAVLSKQTEGRTNSLFYSREHQDAQELFQVLSECLKNEIGAVDREGVRDRGLGLGGGVGGSGSGSVGAGGMVGGGMSGNGRIGNGGGLIGNDGIGKSDIGKSVFDGLTANRRSCVVCGYTEAVMHFALDNWQLAVPRLATSCRLEDCLEDYTRLEILKDCICRKCSILATYRRLQQEVKSLEDATKPSSSKKRRLKEVRKMESRVKAALEEGRIEDDLKDVRMEKAISPASTKQAMIARPPKVLALHINRSVHFGQYASKNTVRLIFPEVLDLTPYTTSGNLSTIPTAAISTPPPPPLPRSTTPTPATYAHTRTIYRLAAVVCHFGQHSFGHYICYRRKPKPVRLGAGVRWRPPKLVDPLRVEEDEVDGKEGEGKVGGGRYLWDDDEDEDGEGSVGGYGTGKGWLRISDDAVRECGIESVLAEGSGAFMLYYERAVEDRVGVYARGSASPRSSEETLKPEMRTVALNGSVNSLVSEVGFGVARERDKPGVSASSQVLLGARVVRSVAAGRRRTRSVSGTPSSSSDRMSASVCVDIPKKMNGHAVVDGDEDGIVPESMTSSAPALLPSKPVLSSSAPSVLSHVHSALAPPPRIHSPQPHHPPTPSSVVGLKA